MCGDMTSDVCARMNASNKIWLGSAIRRSTLYPKFEDYVEFNPKVNGGAASLV